MTNHFDSPPKSIWAIGRNYSEHAREMGSTVPKEPLVFLKSVGCIVHEGKLVTLPKFSQSVNHELELALRVSEDLKSFSHYTLALDLTARDFQNEAKKNGTPWTPAKSFKDACPLGSWIPVRNQDDLIPLEFELLISGELRQKGKTLDMIFKPLEILRFLNSQFPLSHGDVVLTGTPSGVADVKAGDIAIARFTGGPSYQWKFA